MGVVICLPLFGPPGRELEEGEAIQGPRLRRLAAELSDRLQRAADTLDRLAADGWGAKVAMYDVMLERAGVETPEEATRRLRELGVAPEELLIIEEVED
jgi:Mn-dependent DtxR family transcriptional regulator